MVIKNFTILRFDFPYTNESVYHYDKQIIRNNLLFENGKRNVKISSALFSAIAAPIIPTIFLQLEKIKYNKISGFLTIEGLTIKQLSQLKKVLQINNLIELENYIFAYYETVIDVYQTCTNIWNFEIKNYLNYKIKKEKE